MIYLYKCVSCDVVVEVTKPLSELARVEKCEECGEIMIRVFTAPSIKTGDGLNV